MSLLPGVQNHALRWSVVDVEGKQVEVQREATFRLGRLPGRHAVSSLGVRRLGSQPSKPMEQPRW